MQYNISILSNGLNEAVSSFVGIPGSRSRRWLRLFACMLMLMPSVLLPNTARSKDIAPPRVRTFSKAGEPYANLKEVARFYGLDKGSARSREVSLRSKWTDLRFETGSRKMWMNRLMVWLHVPSVRNRSHWALAKEDVDTVLDPLLRPNIYLQHEGSRTIILDPGHGGVDRGCRGPGGTQEKDVVLEIAERARVHLANAGLKVYLTRNGDRKIGLAERPQKARHWRGDVFVSIHLNASATPGASGIETFVMTSPGYPSTNARQTGRTKRITYKGNNSNGANIILGYLLQKNLLKKTNAEDRGVRRARFAVLKNVHCPAALVECGFLSHRAEENKFKTYSYREKVAKAIATGIIEYVGAVERAKLSMP